MVEKLVSHENPKFNKLLKKTAIKHTALTNWCIYFMTIDSKVIRVVVCDKVFVVSTPTRQNRKISLIHSTKSIL